MSEIIESKRPQLDALCAKYGVRRLQPFGSVVAGSFDPATSDIDFLVEFSPGYGGSALLTFFGFKEELESLFGRPVDLVEPQSIRNPHFLRAVLNPQGVTMQDRVLKLLFDMRQGCEGILQFTAGKTRQDYEGEIMLRLAVERQLEIVGEALNQMLKLDPSLEASITSARKIVDLRNILIHAYSTTDNDKIWGIVQDHLPTLLSEVRQLQQKLGLKEDDHA